MSSKNLCGQLTRKPDLEGWTFAQIITFRTRLDQLDAEMEKLRSSIAKSRQFNKKEELNLELKKKEQEIARLFDE